MARVVRLHETGSLGTQAPTVVLREMLAMANSHSKSKVPVSVLNDPGSLRRMMLIAATTDLHVLYRQQRAEKASASGATEAGPGASRGDGPRAPQGPADAPSTQAMEAHPISALCDGVIAGPEGRNAFAWLESGNTLARELIEDVIDTLRSLRCADALRQRGTVLKTSGNCEIFVDQRTANAIYALRPDDQHLCLLEIPDQINAGEANLSSQLDADGNLRISFVSRHVHGSGDGAKGGALRGAGRKRHSRRRDRELRAKRWSDASRIEAQGGRFHSHRIRERTRHPG